MGLDIYLEWDGQTKDERMAQRAGTDTGECGYLRSSYNQSGFNIWASNNSIGDLYYIFDRKLRTGNEEDGGKFKPNWDECMVRALEVQIAVNKTCDEGLNTLQTHLWNNEVFDTIGSALNHVKQDMKAERPPDFNNFSNRRGEFFYGKPLPVVAIMLIKDYVGKPTPLLIYKDTSLSYYKEFMNGVIAFINTGKEKDASISWSA
jgi:hypothetical protein